MTKKRYALETAFDVSIGVLMIVIIVGAVTFMLTPGSPQVLTATTTTPSIIQSPEERGTQEVRLIPARSESSYITLVAPAKPDSSTGTAVSSVPNQFSPNYTTGTPAVATIRSANTTDYMYVLAVATAILVVFNVVNYSIGLLYRIGIPQPKQPVYIHTKQ